MASERTKLFPLLGCMVLLAACPNDLASSPAWAGGETDEDAGVEPDEATPHAKPSKPETKPDAKPTTPETKPDTDNAGPNTPANPTTPSKPNTSPSDTPPPAQPMTPNKPSTTPPPASARPFFLPTPEPRNTQFPRIEIDANGGLHAAYPAHAGSGAFYAYCPNNCVDPSAMKVVELPTDAVPNTAMLALTPDGRPRVLIPTYLHVYYAECDRNCSDESNWTTSMIVDHQSQQEVTGDAFAVDSQGRPRFIMHTYVAYLGVGQKPPFTYYAQCDRNCSAPANWQIDAIQDQIWQYSTLRFDAQDRAHLGTIAIFPTSSVKQVAYVRCDANCESSTSWSGIQLAPAFELSTAEIRPSVSLALTKAGAPRVVALVMPEPGARSLVYFECEGACDQDNWSYAVMSTAWELGSGVDIAVDAEDKPRFVFTLKHNIGLYHCDATRCTDESAPWDLAKVEFSSDLTPDTIILWPNCVADAWFLHDPTLALTADGSARVGYMASDVSGGWNNMPDPTMTPCLIGKDMTFARMASLPAF